MTALQNPIFVVFEHLKSAAMENCSYRVSHNTVSTFVFWISQLPRGLEIPSWTFFNCPFRVEFENVHHFIIWWNLDWDICKLLQGSHFKSWHFMCFLIQRLRSHEHKGAVLSTLEHSWALRSILRQLRESCLGTMSALECSWMITSAQEYSLCHGTMLKMTTL